MITKIEKNGIAVVTDEPLEAYKDIQIQRISQQIHLLHYPIWDTEEFLCGTCAFRYPCDTLNALNNEVLDGVEINEEYGYIQKLAVNELKWEKKDE